VFEQNPLRVSFSSQKTNLACHLSYKTYKTEYSEPIKLTSLHLEEDEILELAQAYKLDTHMKKEVWMNMPDFGQACHSC
jgi:hypothetical protein